MSTNKIMNLYHIFIYLITYLYSFDFGAVVLLLVNFLLSKQPKPFQFLKLNAYSELFIGNVINRMNFF